ncbi:hypothetical protein KCP75_18770 [Salmonella enterica subsp. enterica]|nr:hypothetical protein KCP75_18770 [Salmonella enterica subsp. enterica]
MKLINDSEAISNATYPALSCKQKVQWRLSEFALEGIIRRCFIDPTHGSAQKICLLLCARTEHGEAKRRAMIAMQ